MVSPGEATGTNHVPGMTTSNLLREFKLTSIWLILPRLVLGFLLILCLPQLSYGADRKFSFDIPAQRADTALSAFAQQVGQQVLFPIDRVNRFTTNRLTGQYTAREAIKILLDETGLIPVFSKNQVLTIELEPKVHMVEENMKTQKNLFANVSAFLVSALGVTGAAAENTTQEKASFAIEEVVVTAQKRGQSAQDVSIAISAFDENTIRRLGIQEARDLGSFTPNLNVKNSTGVGNPIFTLRGLGVGSFVSNLSPSVGMYVDEIYLPSNNMMTFATFDIERVEVLKGPQGTLFGRNTTGGAISFITKKPSLEESEGFVTLTLGNYDTTNIEGAFGTPINDELAVRLALKSQRQDEGFMYDRVQHEGVNDIDKLFGRLSLLWQPSDALAVNFNVHYGRDRSGTGPWEAIGTSDPSAPTIDPNAPLGARYTTRCPAYLNDDVKGLQASCVDVSGYRDPDGGSSPFKGVFSNDRPSEVDSEGALLSISYNFENDINLTAITGYEHTDRNAAEDFDGGPGIVSDNIYDNDIDAFSQEVRLSSNTDLVDWMAGVFYSKDSNDTNDINGYADRFQTDLLVSFEQETTTSAAYLHTQWHVTDTIDLIAGVRYTTEETSWDGATYSVNVVGTTGFSNIFGDMTNAEGDIVEIYGGGEAARDETIEEDKVTYKIGLDYKPNENWLLYANVSKGFKSGGFNGTWASAYDETRPYFPEELIAYEVGFKGTMLDGLLQINAGAYTYDYTDIQIFGVDANGKFGISNASDSDVEGFEMDIWYRPIEGLDIKAGLAYNDAVFVDHQSATTDLSGNRLPNASKTSYNVLVRYEFPLGNGLVLAPMAAVNYKGKIFYQDTNFEMVAQDSYHIVDANISLYPEGNDKWEISLWGKNIADKEYDTDAFVSGSAGVASRLPGAPRTYGASFTYRFN